MKYTGARANAVTTPVYAPACALPLLELLHLADRAEPVHRLVQVHTGRARLAVHALLHPTAELILIFFDKELMAHFKKKKKKKITQKRRRPWKTAAPPVAVRTVRLPSPRA